MDEELTRSLNILATDIRAIKRQSHGSFWWELRIATGVCLGLFFFMLMMFVLSVILILLSVIPAGALGQN
jgi:4-amino-4-deoxy-L-arabinose transferase-like glycosyltransferase